MQMFLWSAINSVTCKVNTPAVIAGNYTAVEGAFSTANSLATKGPITAPVVYFDDAAGGTHLACTGAPLTSLTGKIALINRGTCSFVIKVKEAQIAGALAVIMVNNAAGAPIIMGGTDNTITIPAVMISNVDGATFAAQIANNLNVTLSAITGQRIDGDLDNGIIVHEYGHGISNRLTGGPANVSCLSNAEQGGEGWSDYVSLMMTHNWATAGVNDGALSRGIGTYAIGEPTTGRGIRNFPYSTNMTIQPSTYAGVQTTGGQVHAIGEIWCAALWDMTWAIIQQENSINTNLYNFTPAGTGGNSIALKLVLEGMKLQPCSPGFLDARNAIIQADQNLYAGRHFCTIWAAFARRGMGFSAVQGSSNNTNDQTQAFDLPPAATFTAQPAGTTVCLGTPVTFTIAVSGTATYQWQVSSNSGSTWTNIAGETAVSYTFTPILTDNANQYRCVATGVCGAVNSNAAVLGVATGSTGGTLSPAAANVCVGANGNTTTLTLSTQIGNIIRWESSIDGGTTWINIANTTTTLIATNLAQTTLYRAFVQSTGCAGAYSSTATITGITGIGALTIFPTPGAILCQGDPALLTVMTPTPANCTTTTGTIAIAIPDNTPAGIISTQTVTCAPAGTVLSAVAVTLNITHTWDSDLTIFLKSPSGRIINLVNRRGGSGDNFTNTVISSTGTAPLTNLSASAPFTGTFAADLSAAAVAPTGWAQSDATFASFITNSPAPNGVWTLAVRDNANLDFGTIVGWSLALGYNVLAPAPAGLTYTWTPAAGLASTSGNPVAASPTVSTNYTVNVSNGAGCTGSASIAITVNQRPAITAQPVATTICATSNATFSVTATGTALTYQWQVSTNNCSTYTNITGATAATLNLTGVTSAMNGNGYRCIVSGVCTPTAISNCVKLTVNDLPVVAVTPTSGCGGVAGVNGLLLSTGSFAPPIPGSATFTASPNLAIPDGPPTWPQTSFVGVSTNLAVSGIPANASITGVSVKLNIPHTYIADLVIVLKAPNGAVLNLDANISKTGGAGANFVNTIINSTSTTALSAGAPPYTGAFKPDAEGAVISQQGTTFPGGPTTPAGYIPTVSAFNGLYSVPNGNWSLGIYDWGLGDVGTLTNWELVINYTTPGGAGNPLTFTWSPAAGLYTDATATTPYVAGTQTPQVYAAPTTFTTYTVTGTNALTGCSNTATALINYTPPPPTVTPNPVTICLDDIAKLKSVSSVTTVKTYSSGAINVAIPEGSFPNPPATAGTNTIAVSGIPANAVITGINVKTNITHGYVGDVIMVLKAPNNAIFNLDAMLNKTNNPGVNFVDNVISSSGTTLLSAGSAPFTGTFKADAVGATFSAFGFTLAGGPIGYAPTTTAWNGLYSQPNGNWTIAAYDAGAPDVGNLTSWSLEITYVVGVITSAATWSPVTGLYSDAAATVPYVAGTQVDSVYTKAATTTMYNVNVNSLAGPTGPSVPVATNFAPAFYYGLVTFNFKNNNTYPVIITDIASQFAFTGLPGNTGAYYKTSAINGAPGAINTANGWNVIGQGTVPLELPAVQPFLTGLSLVVPAGATYGIAVEAYDAFGYNLVFSAPVTGTPSFTNAGCTITTGTNISYAGDVAPNAPTFAGYGFIGNVSFAPAGECTSPARSVVVTVNTPIAFTTQPVNAAVCTDKVTSFTAVATGSAIAHNWQVSTQNGTPGTWTDVANGGVYAGAKTTTLTITAPPVSMNGYVYRDSVSTSPCIPKASNIVKLTVNPLPTIVIGASPYKKLFPGLTTTLFSTVTPAAATGGYTWLRNGLQVPGAASSLVVDVNGLGDYSLRVNDINGCTNTSNIVSITDSASGKVFIYPTPNSGQFQVRYYSIINNTGLPRGLNVYDARGKKVFIQAYSITAPYARMDVNLRNHGTGVYWVEVVDVNGNRLAIGRTEVLR
jgi:subtilisin-like proprotein convertase family protein